MNVIHSVEDNNAQIIHVSVNSNDRGATGEKGDSVTNLRITEENRLEATLSNGQTIDGGAVPAIKTRRVFVANMDGTKRTYILPLNIESSQVSYILMNGIAYSDGYVLQSGEITLNYDDLPSGRLEVVLNDNAGNVGDINVSINGKTGDIHLRTINGANLDGDGDIELATLDAFNNEVRTREETDNNLRNSLNDHEARISNNESTVSSHSNNLSSLNASISSINNQMTVLTDDMHEVTDNYVPKTRRINDKFLSHDVRLNADDVEALPITAGITHPVRGELVVNGHITAENATQGNHVVTKAQLDAKVAEVVNSAPETLDTLEELSKALGDDPNFATTIANKIGTVDKKIDTEVNKLSNKVEVNTENLKTITEEANANSTNISLLNSTVATNKLSSDTQFSNVAKEQSDQDTLISDILNAFSAESEKGTNLKLNSSATKVLGVSIYGNLEQKKYTGKNLLKLSTNPTISNGLSSTVSDDGLVKYSGKITDSWGDITTLLYFPAPLPAGKYTFSIDHPRTHRIIFKYKLADNTFSEIIANMTATSISNTFTTTQPIVAGYLYIAAVNSSNLNDTVKAQLEISDTATDYEPYTGGYNNLFDEFSELPVNKNGLKLENVNGILKFTGMPTTDWNTMISRDITTILSDKTDYTVVQYNTYGHKLYPAIVAYKADGSGGDETNAINSKTFSFRVDKTKYNRYVMKLQVATRASFSKPVTVYNNYALFQGNYTKDNLPEYSPYNTGLASPRPQLPQPINSVSDTIIYVQGKNLFDTRFGERTINGVSVKTYPDGSFGLNGTPTTGFSLSNTLNSKTRIPDGNYKYKIELLGGSVTKIWDNAKFIFLTYCQKDVNIQYKEPTTISGTINIANKDEYFTQYLWIPFGGDNNTAYYTYNNLRCRITLVKSDEEIENTPPFESNIFESSFGDLRLYKIGDYQDYITMRNDKWYLIRNTAIKILNGSENWIKTAEPENIFICQNIINATKNYDDAYFSHFNNIKRCPNIDKTGAICGDNGTNIAFCMNNIPNITGLKNWLSKNNVTVLYPISGPITAEITDSTTLAELNKLKQLRTYDGTTNIIVTATGVTPEIKIKYLPNLKGLGE